MKKLYTILLILALFISLTGCASQKSLAGNWETISLVKEGIYQEIVQSNLKLELQDDTFSAKGCAGVNLYIASIKVKGNSFTAYGMQNTGFYGQPGEMEFEDMFFDVLMNADSYRIQDDTLFIYCSAKKMELQLKKLH